MKTGIYKITHIGDLKFYIGSTTIDFYIRWANHSRQLRKNRHINSRLQNAWNKYSAEAFIFEILEECPAERCIEREQFYLDTLLFASENDDRFNELGYNICRTAGNTLGFKHREKSKQQMSLKTRGEKKYNASLTDTQVKSILDDLFINGLSVKAIVDKTKISRSIITSIKLGTKWKHIDRSQYNIDNYQRAKVSTETKQKISQLHTGKINSQETKLKISQANKNKKRSQEVRLKISKATTGHQNPNSILNEELVIQIRELHKRDMTYKELAILAGTTVRCVAKVCRKETWRHI